MRPTFDEIYKKLSTVFSFIDEDVDEDEVNEFIEYITENSNKDEIKEIEKEQSKKDTLNNHELNEELFRGLETLLIHKNSVLSSSYFDISSEKGSSIASYIQGLFYENGIGVN